MYTAVFVRRGENFAKLLLQQVLKGKRGRGKQCAKYRVRVSIDRQLVVAVVAIMSPPLPSLSSGKEEEEEEGY